MSGAPPQPPPWAIEHLYGGPDPFKDLKAKGKPKGMGSAWRVPVILVVLLVLSMVAFFLIGWFIAAKL